MYYRLFYIERRMSHKLLFHEFDLASFILFSFTLFLLLFLISVIFPKMLSVCKVIFYVAVSRYRLLLSYGFKKLRRSDPDVKI